MKKIRFKQHSVMPGFGLTMGYTLFYLSLIVLIPLSALVFKTATLTWARFWEVTTSERVMASYRLTFGTALLGAVVNAFFGFIVAWCLVRYRFPGRRIMDALVDLPFALPTAVSGIALTAIYAPNGWVGEHLEKWNASGLRGSLEAWYAPVAGWVRGDNTGWSSYATGLVPPDLEIKAAYSQLGIIIAMTFIGLPFVVRTLQPAIQELEAELEDAAASLGADRWQTFRRVIMPVLFPALLTGFGLSFARAVGEYGSIVFISGNMPMKTEVTPLLIVAKLEEYDYAGATAIAVVMLVASFVILFAINLIQWWTGAHKRA
ncbi:MAG: sulfate ABC transporter permease subunit CysT [Planctomycetes bacterium]|nr:sulfate ABC transporter permease subunit CysT [Planctomycetota bacterium]